MRRGKREKPSEAVAAILDEDLKAPICIFQD